MSRPEQRDSPLDPFSRHGVDLAERSQPRTVVPPRRRRTLLPTLLFVATCASMQFVGGRAFVRPLMITITMHEVGHFLQSHHYG